MSEKELKPTYLFVMHLVFDTIRGRVPPAQKKTPVAESAEVKQVLIYLENRLFEHLDASDIADKLGASRASLYRKFKSATGKSIVGYVRHRRMEEARQLMRGGSLKLGNFAQLVGYEDLFSFSTAYKNIYGVAPSKDPEVIRTTG